ncbi:MAG: glycerol-3-phosphate 1-O-acyltransferase PlsY [Phycisphaerales bacterium]|nr:glycerol-3-phosphate 1-O-acyltransferase PlsY [Phycisphaerales bacterium]
MSGPAVVGILAVACYLIGSIPFGLVVGRCHGIDVRTAGSGNIGATNVGRLLGRKWGILVFVLDVLKGLVPTFVAGRFIADGFGQWGWSATAANVGWLLCGVCCILGHNFPIYLRFRGGKGVATSLGVLLGVYPYLTVAGLLAAVIWAVVTLTTRYVSLGSIVAAGALPVIVVVSAWLRGGDALKANLPMVGFALLACALVIYRHRGNLARLRAGTENKIGSRKQATSVEQ